MLSTFNDWEDIGTKTGISLLCLMVATGTSGLAAILCHSLSLTFGVLAGMKSMRGLDAMDSPIISEDMKPSPRTRSVQFLITALLVAIIITVNVIMGAWVLLGTPT